jgi:hypothetical protein
VSFGGEEGEEWLSCVCYIRIRLRERRKGGERRGEWNAKTEG